jgi:hypothetical protein
MHLEVVRPRKRGLAHRALERMLACVYTHVYDKVALYREALSAHLARERLLSCVCPYVYIMRAFCGEAFVARGAFKR